MGKKSTIRFACEDIAEAKGVTIHAVYAAIKRGVLNTSSLSSIIDYVTNKGLCVKCTKNLRVISITGENKKNK